MFKKELQKDNSVTGNAEGSIAEKPQLSEEELKKRKREKVKNTVKIVKDIFDHYEKYPSNFLDQIDKICDDLKDLNDQLESYDKKTGKFSFKQGLGLKEK